MQTSVPFFEIYGMSARTRGVKPVWTFFEKVERGSIFDNFCGRLLWTAPYEDNLFYKKFSNLN